MMDRRTFLACLLASAGGRLLRPLSSVAAGDQKILRVAVISDLNHSYGSIGYDPPIHRAIKRIVALQPDLVLCTGDMIAGQRTAPRLKQDRLQSMWRSFFQAVARPLAKAGIPLAVTPGNHDASASPGFRLERRVYRQQWDRHRPQLSLLPGGDYPFHYAFVLKNVLFISLDVTVTSPLKEAQRTWLAELLAGGAKYRARIVLGHIPFAPLTVGRERSILRDPDLEQLLVDSRVTLYLSGHHHGYYPFYHKGLHCVGQAAIGSGPRRLIGTDKRSPRAITMVEIPANGRVRISAFRGWEFQQPLLRSTLPAKISVQGNTAVRDDLAGFPGTT
jgi:hypothetical protein